MINTNIVYVIFPPVIKRGNGNSTDDFPIQTSSYIFPLPRLKRVNSMLINMKFYGICSLVTVSKITWLDHFFVPVEFIGTLGCPKMAYPLVN